MIMMVVVILTSINRFLVVVVFVFVVSSSHGIDKFLFGYTCQSEQKQGRKDNDIGQEFNHQDNDKFTKQWHGQ